MEPLFFRAKCAHRRNLLIKLDQVSMIRLDTTLKLLLFDLLFILDLLFQILQKCVAQSRIINRRKMSKLQIFAVNFSKS